MQSWPPGWHEILLGSGIPKKLHLPLILRRGPHSMYVYRFFVLVLTGSILSSGFGCDCDEFWCMILLFYFLVGLQNARCSEKVPGNTLEAPADHVDSGWFPRNHWLFAAGDFGYVMICMQYPPKFNIAPEKLPGPNRKVVFQPPFFRGYVKLWGSIFLYYLRGCICHLANYFFELAARD